MCYQTYLLDGLNLTLEAIREALVAGAQLRSVVFAKVAAPEGEAAPAAAPEKSEKPDKLTGAAADKAAAAAAAAAAIAAAAAAEPPEWFKAVRAQAEAAVWDDPLAQLAALEVALPPSTPPPAGGCCDQGSAMGVSIFSRLVAAACVSLEWPRTESW